MHQTNDAHLTTPVYYEPEAVNANAKQHKLRVLIDEIATTRGLTIQMSLRLMSLVAAQDDESREQIRDEFFAIAAQFSDNIELLFGTSMHPVLPHEQVAWIRRIATSNPDRAKTIRAVKIRVDAIVEGLKEHKAPNFKQARRFYERNWPVVRDELTAIIWDLWADLDQQKNRALADNEKLHSTLSSTLNDIKKFSTAVRMVALNTSVLASRPKDAGAGFKVIASEVKRLAEEIQSSANSAEKAAANMNQNL